jgi:hypothetical protein
MGLEVRLVCDQCAIILDRNHYRSLRAMTGDRWGPSVRARSITSLRRVFACWTCQAAIIILDSVLID